MTHNVVQRGAIVAAVMASGCMAQAQSHLMRYADVHEDKVVFSYEGDLWLASTEGGTARRVTRDPGDEMRGKFSPDGRQIAFSANYDGGYDVYVMDARGGVPERLTYHPAGNRVLDWTPDGKSILFRSRREYSMRGEQAYVISLDGGMPQKLNVDRAGLTTMSPDGKRIAYNRNTREQRTWKRHQGGTAQDIWMGSLATGDYQRITDWVGTDNYPMWHGNAIYFTSDREYGTLNIFKYDIDSRKVTALTHYKDYDVKFPSIGPDQIVYQYGEALHLLDLKTGKIRKPEIEMISDRVRMRPEFVGISPSQGSFGLSPSGTRMVLEARGEILNLPIEDGEPVNLTKATASHEKNGAWSPDGKWIMFISDETGEEELYLVDQLAEKPWRQLTTDGFGFRMQPVWSPDSKWLVFSDKFLRLNLVDAESGDITVIDRSDYDDGWERWGIQDYAWSPDSKWVAYTKLEQSINDGIFLYSIADKKSYRVTDDLTADFSPSFDPAGRYLYFLSHRDFDPVMGFVDQNHVFLDMCRPYMVVLKDTEPSPFILKDSKEEVKEEEETASEDEKADDEENGKKEGEAEEEEEGEADDDIQIDLEGIGQRIIAAKGVPPGNYFRLEATEKGFLYLKKNEHEFEKYQSVTDRTSGSLDLYHYKLDDAEAENVLGGIANYHLSADGKKLVYRSASPGPKGRFGGGRGGSTYGVVDVGAKAKVGDGKVELDAVKVEVDRNLEFLQIFNEAWRVQRDFFYEPNMHGVDWPAIGEKYRKLVPYCGDRSDLNYLIGEMIGELNIGHSYIGGGDIKDEAKRVPVGLLGASFEAQPGAPYYQITHIIPGTPWNVAERSPLAELGCPIKVGDYLIAIDGEEVTTADNVYKFLQNKRETVVTLTYNDTPTSQDAKTHRVKTLAKERAIRYREWVDKNRTFVEKATNGKVAYLHIPDMGRSGLGEFAKIFYPHYYKKGLIVDVRYNGGGFTSDMIVNRLERKLWSLTQPREGKPLHEPERCFFGHWNVLINEDTGSSGEWFAARIQDQKLAPMIGMRTWGGAIGIEPHQFFLDGGLTTPPQFAPYDLNRNWLIEGHGIDPDIEVQNMPGDVLRGKDAQLETAIDWVMKRMADDPREIPARPAYPDKSKK